MQFDTEITDLQKVVNESIDKQDGLNSDIQKIVDYYNKQRESIEDLVMETNKKTFANNQNIDQICIYPLITVSSPAGQPALHLRRHPPPGQQ